MNPVAVGPEAGEEAVRVPFLLGPQPLLELLHGDGHRAVRAVVEVGRAAVQGEELPGAGERLRRPVLVHRVLPSGVRPGSENGV